MKKFSKLLAVILALSLLVVPVSAKQGTNSASLTYQDIRITVDGEQISPVDVNGKTVDPFLIDNTTYLPIRAVAEALGCSVAWDDATSTITIDSDAPETISHTLMAGAGVGEIKWDASVIAANNEGFSGEYLDPLHPHHHHPPHQRGRGGGGRACRREGGLRTGKGQLPKRRHGRRL
jgi:hypothetical protein